MSRHCKCSDYKRIIDALNTEQDAITLDSEYFLFCPWCGVRLIAPCHICGEPSNIHTGNTLYWYGDKDFCSAACTRKLDMSFATGENN